MSNWTATEAKKSLANVQGAIDINISLDQLSLRDVVDSNA
jgi:hypothetical protein